MDEKKVREILGPMIRGNDMRAWLYVGDTGSNYVGEGKKGGCSGVVLDGFFTPDQLKALAWWIENKEKG